MGSGQYEDQKRPLQFSKKQIDKAARNIRHGIEGLERIEAKKTIQGYREYHLYPLMLLTTHLRRTSKRVNPKTVVVRRLKQLSTIIDKLERPTLDGEQVNAIKLTRMQDIAGCRAIVNTPAELYSLKEKLEKSKSVHRIIKVSNYLDEPKKSGYGGYHIIYSCYAEQHDHSWNKALVEVQLRTQLQHAWATSLEIIDTLEDIQLKTSVMGHKKWRQFFEIFGRLIAHEEGLCLISDSDYSKFASDFHDLQTELRVHKKLADYSLALQFTSASSIPKSLRSGDGLFLVLMKKEMKNSKHSVAVKYYKRVNSKLAIAALNEAELSDKFSVAVLISSENSRNLRQAYPNYFGSTATVTNFMVKISDKVITHLTKMLKNVDALFSYYISGLESKSILDDEQKAKLLRIREAKLEHQARLIALDL